MKINAATFLKFIYFAAYFIVVVAFIISPKIIQTDLLGILPESDENNLKNEVFAHASKNYTAQVNILFATKNIQQAKEAGLFFASLVDINNANVQFEIAQDKIVFELLAKHNYHLLSDNQRQTLHNKNYAQIKNTALALLYSPVKASILPLRDDPFMLSTDFVMKLGLLKSGFSPNMDVLAASYNDKTYAYMMVHLDQNKLFSPAYLLPAMAILYDAQEKTLEHYDHLEIIMTGVPVHSAVATQNSIAETSFISIVALVFILLATILAFRSLKCFFYAVFTVGFSFLFAFSLTHLIFGYIHIFVLVFGASLIGLCIDYHLHYFVERGYSKDSILALTHIKKAIRISIITSLTGFAVLIFSNIGLLTQMAVFAIAGLLNAYLIIRFFYPTLMKHSKIKPISNWVIKLEATFSALVIICFQKLFYLKVFLLLALFGLGVSFLHLSYEIKDLYVPNETLLANELTFAKVSGIGAAPVMYIIQGDNAEEVLQTEESIRVNLDQLVNENKLSGYKAISQIVASKQRQQENYAYIRELFSAEFIDYSTVLGVKKDDQEFMLNNILAQQTSFLTVDELLDNRALANFKSLWTTREGKAISIMMLENASDKAALVNIIKDEQDVFYGDKLQEYSDILKTCLTQALIAITITFFVIFSFITLYYKSPARAFTAILPSILAVVITAGVFGFLGVKLSLFHVLALFLVICFGVDYSIFRIETKNKIKHSGVAVMLSCITTIASFGTLAFTSFEVTKALGMTLGLGIFLSYIFSPLATLYQARSHHS